MKKCAAALALFFAASCVASAQKTKPNKFLPPAESHGMTINGYGCDKQQVLDVPASNGSSMWRLIVWSQYGKDHKRYWQKTYGTYKVEVKYAVSSSGESAASGAPIGADEAASYDFSSMDKICNDWGLEVKSNVKTDPNESAKPGPQ